MREILFRVLSDRPGQLVAQVEGGSVGQSLHITAQSFEELRHEARDALIQHFGAAHATYRVKLLRRPERGLCWSTRL